MLKIWNMKRENAQKAGRSGKSSAEMRVQKDVNELELPQTMKVFFPDPQNLLEFTLTIEPDGGLYAGGRFNFKFDIGKEYPYEPPKVKCSEVIYHPNIDVKGNVCLNILREDWKPVLNLNSITIGLQYLFLNPNPDDPLNTEAATELRSNPEAFSRNVQKTMNGNSLNGVQYANVIARPNASSPDS